MSASSQRATWINSFAAATGLKPGEYGQHSKLSIRALAYVNWSLNARVYSIMFQQAFGYDGELGVIMSKSKFPKAPPVISPITPRGLTMLLEAAAIEGYKEAGEEIDQSEVRVSKYRLREALQDLDDKGLISRCRINCPATELLQYNFTEALKKGLITDFHDLSAKQRQGVPAQRVTVYLLAHPRKPKSMEPYRGSVAEIRYCQEKGADSKHDKRGGYQFFLEFVGNKALAKKLLQKPAVRTVIEQYDRELSEVRGSLETMKQRQQELLKGLKSYAEQAAQMNLFDDSPVPEPVPAPIEEPRPAALIDWDTVGRAAAEYATINDIWVQQIVSRCQKETPDVTPAEIAQMVHQKGRAATKKDNPAGFLMNYVPQDCKGESFRRMRERLKYEAQKKADAAAAAAEPLPEYREPTTADLMAECDRRIAGAREQLKATKQMSDIVKIEDRIHFLHERKKQLERQLTEVAS